MAHRKHLSQEGHAEPEKKATKHEQKQTTGNTHPGKFEKKSQPSNNYGKPGNFNKENKQNPGNSHIKDEHGEY